MGEWDGGVDYTVIREREIIEMGLGNEKKKRPKGHRHVSVFKKGCF